MNLDQLLATLDAPIVIRPTRRMTLGELETYLHKAADILRGNADHSEFRGYVFALLFYKRINDCFEEEVRAQTTKLRRAGIAEEQADYLARRPEIHHFVVPEPAAWGTVARTAKATLVRPSTTPCWPSSAPTPTGKTTASVTFGVGSRVFPRTDGPHLRGF